MHKRRSHSIRIYGMLQENATMQSAQGMRRKNNMFVRLPHVFVGRNSSWPVRVVCASMRKEIER